MSDTGYKSQGFGEKKWDGYFPGAERAGRISISAMLMAVSITCGLLNPLVFSNSPWALLIIGACLVGWMFVMPAFVSVKLPVYAYLLFDGVAVAIYLYLITYVIGNFSWFMKLALPIVAWVFILMEIFVFCGGITLHRSRNID